MSKTTDDTLLQVNDLCMYFDVGGRTVKASEHISFSMQEGEIFGLVGESGSGKSTIGKCIIGLNKKTSGELLFHGQALTGKPDPRIQMIFQDPMSSLNPKMQVGEIIGEALDVLIFPADRDSESESPVLSLHNRS